SSDPTTQKFTVTVSGPNYVISSLRADDIMLTTSVSDITEAGKYRLAVAGARNSSKSGYEFVSVSPQTIEVTVDNFDTKEFDVEPNIVGVGTPSNKDLIAETPVISDSSNQRISIRGPRSVMQKIATVEAYYEVNQILSSTQNFNCEIRLLDTNGALIYRYGTDNKIYDINNKVILKNYLQLDFTSVNVTQRISKEKTLKVLAQFNNIPSKFGKGTTLNDDDLWSCDYKEVVVRGTPDVVDSMTELTLSPIDFRNISIKSNTFEVSPILPDGVTLSDQNKLEYFTVKIDVSDFKINEYEISSSKVEFINVASGLKASIDVEKPPIITVCGDENFIDKWNETINNRSIVIDLDGYSTGSFNISNETDYSAISIKDADNVWIVGKYEIRVSLKKK
ncbi:MAG: hypothetical protein J6J13_03720, partial [Clostridia bacterium]|nr:hypothetical protein [Clostridia bacterium]